MAVSGSKIPAHLTATTGGGTLSAMTRRGLVVSDLHVLTKRSVADAALESISIELDQVDVLVLNGDTFDFQWRIESDETVAIAAAIDWLEELLGCFEGREVYFLYGNHDCLSAFRAALEALAERCSTLRIVDYHLRLGNQLFLHGDCANRWTDEAAMVKLREKWSAVGKRGKVNVMLYDLLEKSGLCGVAHRRYFPRQQTVARVAHYLDAVMIDWSDRVDDCHFGHTHLAFRDHVFRGVRFHNTGSAICGMEFAPMEFEFTPDD